MVTAMHPLAAEAGVEILKRGGNAADAAIATVLAGFVVEPFMSGLGGTLYAISHDASSGVTRVFDGTGTAPGEAREDMYELAPPGDPRRGVYGWRATREDASETGFRSIAVPGAAAALDELHRARASLCWEELAEPAARLAEEGFPIDENFFAQRALADPRLRLFPDSASIFCGIRAPDEILAQPALARTLRRLATEGLRSFYEGALAEETVAFVRANGGILSLEDLASYQARVEEPLRRDYRGNRVEILGGSSGGPTVARALDVLEAFDLSALDEVSRVDALARALRAAFQARFQGESPHQHTTHLNAADRDGNLVALTATLGNRFGSAVTVPSTGVLLNDGMMWFDPEPGRPSSIRPGGRALHAAAPTLVFRGPRPLLALGSPGARKIMSSVLQVLVRFLDLGMRVQEAIEAPRIHTEASPTLLMESHFPDAVIEGLRSRGHEVLVKKEGLLSSWFGRPSAIHVDSESGLFRGGMEPYRPGIALGC
jgi:gamma-glutamyltranspeptidase/glutathione hydrolase